MVRALMQASLRLPKSKLLHRKPKIQCSIGPAAPTPSERKMNTTRLLVIASVAVAALGVAGCVKYTYPIVAQPSPPTAAERNFDALWLAAQDVLREYRFTIDRHDRRAGLITTKPLTGMQVFEPWREDAANRTDLADSSLKTLYRTVTVRIQPTAPGSADYEPVVEVAVSKPPPPKREFHSIGAAYGLFALPGSGDEEEERHGILDYEQPEDPNDPNAVGQPIYQDPALARRLTAEIMAKATLRRPMGD